jgi:hypothetical protein
VCRRIDLALGRAIRERLLEHAKLELLGEDAHDCVVDARHGHEALALEFLERRSVSQDGRLTSQELEVGTVEWRRVVREEDPCRAG